MKLSDDILTKILNEYDLDQYVGLVNKQFYKNKIMFKEICEKYDNLRVKRHIIYFNHQTYWKQDKFEGEDPLEYLDSKTKYIRLYLGYSYYSFKFFVITDKVKIVYFDSEDAKFLSEENNEEYENFLEVIDYFGDEILEYVLRTIGKQSQKLNLDLIDIEFSFEGDNFVELPKNLRAKFIKYQIRDEIEKIPENYNNLYIKYNDKYINSKCIIEGLLC